MAAEAFLSRFCGVVTPQIEDSVRPAGCKRKPSPVSETVKVDTFTVSDRLRIRRVVLVAFDQKGHTLLVIMMG